MYRIDDKRRRQLLEDALVTFLLDGTAAAPAGGKARPSTKPATSAATFINEAA